MSQPSRLLPGIARGRERPALHALSGVLPDGTAHHVPVGELWEDRTGVCCHLCGRWFRSVSAHLVSHGWTRQRYLDAFGLAQGTSLECAETRERRAASFIPRRTFEPAVRAGVAAGHLLARSGELARQAAEASRARPPSPQRRASRMTSLARVSPVAQAEANRLRRRRELEKVAADVASAMGFADLGQFVLDRVGRGVSLSAASREAGLHRNWLQRHLSVVAPEASSALPQSRTAPADRRLVERVHLLGFGDVRDYLVARLVAEGCSINAVAAELAVSRYSVEAAIRRHDVRRQG